MHALIVIAKAPRTGFGKTRLIGHGGWTADSVRQLADAFVRDTLSACERVADAQLRICFAPADAAGYFEALAPRARLVPQVEGDLGMRLCAAFEAAFDEGAARVVAIGTDTPHLDPAQLAAAFELLERADCVLGPASDGGYYLIALRSPQPALFEGVAWSTERVLAETMERARSAGLGVAMIAESFDIDVGSDLEQLERKLALAPKLCVHTAEVLAQHRTTTVGPRRNSD